MAANQGDVVRIRQGHMVTVRNITGNIVQVPGLPGIILQPHQSQTITLSTAELESANLNAMVTGGHLAYTVAPDIDIDNAQQVQTMQQANMVAVDWAGTLPTDVTDALNRIAVAVGPIA
jgi:hypothetical protein